MTPINDNLHIVGTVTAGSSATMKGPPTSIDPPVRRETFRGVPSLTGNAVTLVLREVTHGAYVDYYPLNTLATNLFEAFGRRHLPAAQVEALRTNCGFKIEVRV